MLKFKNKYNKFYSYNKKIFSKNKIMKALKNYFKSFNKKKMNKIFTMKKKSMIEILKLFNVMIKLRISLVNFISQRVKPKKKKLANQSNNQFLYN